MSAAVARVSRGLLSTEAAAVKPRVYTAQQGAKMIVARLRADPAGGWQWKERWQWAARLARGDPDFGGRRIFTDAGRLDARYVARVCHRARSRHVLPEGRAWGNLEASIRRILEEIGQSTRGAAL